MRPFSLMPAFIAVVCMFIAGCCSIPALPQESAATLPAVRFLLSFDDGPSPEADENPTEKIAATLAHNKVQPGIKAVFFIQTHWAGAGASPVGQRLKRRLAAEGHILGLHSGSVSGHTAHTKMGRIELDGSLLAGIGDIELVSGVKPVLVRPPYWESNSRTLAAYRRAGLRLLYTDVSARDGSLPLFQSDPQDGGRMNCDIVCFRKRLDKKEIPIVNGVAPIVVTFHDTNRYTAEHLEIYLATLLRAARAAGLEPADPPFYTEHEALRQAAYSRTEANQSHAWHNSIVRYCGNETKVSN